MIGSQPAIFAAISPDKPTAPTPNTTKASPDRGFIMLSTAPAPVWPPQASGPSHSSGTSLRTFTANFSLAMVKLPNDDCWKKAP